jgi:hypothetical protein
MIEVRLTNGDWAEAETPEAAMRCARELWEDAMDTQRYAARSLTATFINALTGAVIVSGVNRATMLRYAS